MIGKRLRAADGHSLSLWCALALACPVSSSTAAPAEANIPGVEALRGEREGRAAIEISLAYDSSLGDPDTIPNLRGDSFYDAVAGAPGGAEASPWTFENAGTRQVDAVISDTPGSDPFVEERTIGLVLVSLSAAALAIGARFSKP